MVLAVALAALSLKWSSLLAAAAVGVLGVVAGAPDGGGGGDAGGGDGGGGGEGEAGGAADGDAGGGDDPIDAVDRISRGEGEGDDAGEADADAEDLDDDDAGLPDEIRNDPKRLRTRLRRAQRQNQAVRPIAERFRDGSGRFLPERDIDRMLGRARDMEELEEFFQEHDDILQTILKRKQGGRAAAPGADQDEVFQDPFADPNNVPFDTTTEGGRALVEMLRGQAKSNHELRQELRRISRQVGDVNQRETTRTLGQIEQSWKTATLAAAREVPEEARPTFVRAVQRAFELAKERKVLNKVNAARIIQDELAPFKKARQGQRRTDAAGRQMRAEGNQKLPRPGGQGRTAAATPNESDKSKGTIRDGRKSFFQRVGMNVPAGR